MYAKEKLYLTADRQRLVRDGDKAAAFLYAMPGDEIPDSAAAKLGLVDGRLKKAGGKPGIVETLLGSSILPAMVAITAELSVQLGQIVARAHKDSGLSVDDWNGLEAADREGRLALAIDAMKAEAAKPKAPPKPKAAPKPKATRAKEQKPAEDKEQKPAGDKGGAGGGDQGGAQQQPPA